MFCSIKGNRLDEMIEEEEEVGPLVDYMKLQHHGKTNFRQIIGQLNDEVNPGPSRFCEKVEIFGLSFHDVSTNLTSPAHWMKNGPKDIFQEYPSHDIQNHLKEVEFCEKQEQRRHFPDVQEADTLFRAKGSWMTFNSGATNQWEEEEKLEEMWEKSREDFEENRERSENSPSKGQLAGRTKYTSISEVPDHLDLEEEHGSGKFLENRWSITSCQVPDLLTVKLFSGHVWGSTAR